jgi:ribosomal protein S18 acetylase RimI-like enzyme
MAFGARHARPPVLSDRLWRVTRTRPARAVYDALAARGVKAATMLLYVAEDAPEVRSPPGVTFARFAGGDPPADARDDAWAEFTDADEALLAFVDGTYAGRVFLSARPVHEAAIDETVAREGVYVWRLYTDPAFRGRGVASSLLSRGRALARERFGTDRAHALVARDNLPSKRTFESVGFEARERVDYARLGPLSRRRWRDLLATSPGKR